MKTRGTSWCLAHSRATEWFGTRLLTARAQAHCRFDPCPWSYRSELRQQARLQSARRGFDSFLTCGTRYARNMPSNAYMRSYMKRRYHERRALAVQTLGGKCACCGGRRLLEIDHKDPRRKTMSFAHMRSVSLRRFMKELTRCQLLCRDCHETKTRDDMGHGPKGEHGTIAMFRHHGCRCALCTSANRRYQRAWRAKRKALQANAE